MDEIQILKQRVEEMKAWDQGYDPHKTQLIELSCMLVGALERSYTIVDSHDKMIEKQSELIEHLKEMIDTRDKHIDKLHGHFDRMPSTIYSFKEAAENVRKEQEAAERQQSNSSTESEASSEGDQEGNEEVGQAPETTRGKATDQESVEEGSGKRRRWWQRWRQS